MNYLKTIVQSALSLLSQKYLNVSSSLDWNGSLLKEIGSTKGNTVSEKSAPPKQPLTIWFITSRPTFRKKEFTASAFVDIKAAFNSAWHPAIIAALIKKNCPLYLLRIIGDYLGNGKAQINIEGRETDISTGCPQGDGILSAFPWITLIDDVFYILSSFPCFYICLRRWFKYRLQPLWSNHGNIQTKYRMQGSHRLAFLHKISDQFP